MHRLFPDYATRNPTTHHWVTPPVALVALAHHLIRGSHHPSGQSFVQNPEVACSRNTCISASRSQRYTHFLAGRPITNLLAMVSGG